MSAACDSVRRLPRLDLCPMGRVVLRHEARDIAEGHAADSFLRTAPVPRCIVKTAERFEVPPTCTCKRREAFREGTGTIVSFSGDFPAVKVRKIGILFAP